MQTQMVQNATAHEQAEPAIERSNTRTTSRHSTASHSDIYGASMNGSSLASRPSTGSSGASAVGVDDKDKNSKNPILREKYHKQSLEAIKEDGLNLDAVNSAKGGNPLLRERELKKDGDAGESSALCANDALVKLQKLEADEAFIHSQGLKQIY